MSLRNVSNMLPAVCFPEDGGTRILSNIGNYSTRSPDVTINITAGLTLLNLHTRIRLVSSDLRYGMLKGSRRASLPVVPRGLW
jgi:hypothetical protein